MSRWIYAGAQDGLKLATPYDSKRFFAWRWQYYERPGLVLLWCKTKPRVWDLNFDNYLAIQLIE